MVAVGSPLEPETVTVIRIELDDVHELLYWTARLGCTSRQLREAIRTVGPRLPDVVAWLRRQDGR